VAEEKWYTRLIYRIYRPRGDFKFSAQLISTLVVAAIIVFQVCLDLLSNLIEANCLVSAAGITLGSRTAFSDMRYMSRVT